jgi:hypothetical protein
MSSPLLGKVRRRTFKYVRGSPIEGSKMDQNFSHRCDRSTNEETPLDDAGFRWCVTPIDGSASYGPAEAEEMRCWLRDGRISADAFVWREDWTQWQRAGAVFPQLIAGKHAAVYSQVEMAPSRQQQPFGRETGIRPASGAPPRPRDARWSDVAPQPSSLGSDWLQVAALSALTMAFLALALTAYIAFRI